MADKPPKAKAKASANEKGVLATMPSSRPERLGAPRRTAVKRAAKPRAVRNGSPDLKAHRAVDPPPRPLGAPRGTELVTTTIRATGELAHIGFTVGRQMLRRTIRRIH
jgi:hypothetical protein